jgi:hypothetical protein
LSKNKRPKSAAVRLNRVVKTKGKISTHFSQGDLSLEEAIVIIVGMVVNNPKTKPVPDNAICPESEIGVDSHFRDDLLS